MGSREALASSEFQDHGVDREAVARLGMYFLHRAVALGAQHVLHLHRLNDGKRFTRLDLLALTHRDRYDETGHGAAHGLAAVRGGLDRHEPRGRGFALGVDEGAGPDSPVSEIEAVGD